MLPRLDRIEAGNLILGLPSVGVHSNGLSLARKVVPFAEGDDLWKELLRPTKIYVRELSLLIETGMVLAAAHITGAGSRRTSLASSRQSFVLGSPTIGGFPDLRPHS